MSSNPNQPNLNEVLAAIAIGGAAGRLGEIHRKEHQELLNALKQKESRVKKAYMLRAANGQDLIAHCDKCGQNMRFPPEFGGELANCIHCNEFIRLYRVEDKLTTACPNCNSSVGYYDRSEHGGYWVGCDHCGHDFNLQHEEAKRAKMNTPTTARSKTEDFRGCLFSLFLCLVVTPSIVIGVVWVLKRLFPAMF